MAQDGHSDDTPDTATEADRCAALDADELTGRAQDASHFLKALAHEGRLMILCHLSSGEKTVTELENLLASRQAAVSQQLARLRLEGLVSTRREGKTIFYAIQDPKVLQTIQLLNRMYIQAA